MFEKIVETINSTSKTVGEKTKQGSDIVKSNLKISAEERALTDLYTEIGKLYFENHKDNPCCETMGELFEKVCEKQNTIEALKHKIRVIKGVVTCDNCGAEVSLENDYCGKCGAKLVKPEPQEEKASDISEEDFDHEESVAEIKIEVAEDDCAEDKGTEE